MALSVIPDPWLACHKRNPQARCRLFCFPYAGGGASVFRGWSDELPASLEVCPVQIPGRETRFKQPAFTRLEPMVDELARALAPYLDLPFALLGHSMGALVAFELARRLRRGLNCEPARLFVSAFGAPHLQRDGDSLHTLPEPAFRKELDRFKGTPTEVMENSELMDILLPTLRADFAVCETYVYCPDRPLQCPIVAFGGCDDVSVPRAELEAWQFHTVASFRLCMLPGDHFFIHTARPPLLRAVFTELGVSKDLSC
jgi:medium-chain acyl-[acyl-carrier-protein] hydrolase